MTVGNACCTARHRPVSGVQSRMCWGFGRYSSALSTMIRNFTLPEYCVVRQPSGWRRQTTCLLARGGWTALWKNGPLPGQLKQSGWLNAHVVPRRRVGRSWPSHCPLSRRAEKGSNVVEHQAEPLGQIDLEVAARYAGATAGESGPLGRLRIEMAVEMASGRLPQTDALEMLDRWMAAPDAVLGDPRRFAEYATAVGIEVAHPVFELWRAQHAALLRDIERLRLQIVQAHSARWRMPHLAPEADGRPPKTVLVAEHLELKHLCAQLRQAGEPPRSQLRRSLEALRDLRNTLSHLEPASLAEIELLGRIYTMLSIRAD